MNMAAPIPNRLNVACTCVSLDYGKGVGRSGPCNPGGVSPSLHNDFPCITGSIFTGPALPHHSQLQIGFREPNWPWWSVTGIEWAATKTTIVTLSAAVTTTIRGLTTEPPELGQIIGVRAGHRHQNRSSQTVQCREGFWVCRPGRRV